MTTELDRVLNLQTVELVTIYREIEFELRRRAEYATKYGIHAPRPARKHVRARAVRYLHTIANGAGSRRD